MSQFINARDALVTEAIDGTLRSAGDRLARLGERMSAGENFVAGLVGARLIADARGLTLVREAGDYRRRGEPVVGLIPGIEAVWDGRFALMVDEPGWRVVPLAGRAARLGREDRAIVTALPAAVRPGLPVLIRDDETGLVLAQSGARVEALTACRLALGLGQVEHEADLNVAGNGARMDEPLFCDDTQSRATGPGGY